MELIAELRDFFGAYVVPRYRGIEAGDYKLLLLEAGREILRGVHPTLAARALASLQREGIEVRTSTRVTRVLTGAVEIGGGESIPVGLTIWAAGCRVTPSADLPVSTIARPIVVDLVCSAGPRRYNASATPHVQGGRASIPIIPSALAHASSSSTPRRRLEGPPAGYDRIQAAGIGLPGRRTRL